MLSVLLENMDLAILIIAVWILSTCFHEFGHAIFAYWGGDKSVKEKGYLTLNPIVYFHSATTLVIPVLVLMIGGIPLPGAAVIINTGRIKSRFMQSLVSFAGPLFTLLFMILLVIFLALLPSLKATIGDAHVYSVLLHATHALIFLHIFVFILNLLPLPPLDGWGILEPWLPAAVRRKARELSNLGFLLLIALFWFCEPFSIAMSFVSQLTAMLLGVDMDFVRTGIKTLRNNSYPLLGLIVVAWIVKSKMAPPQELADKLMKQQKYEEALPLYEAAVAKKEDAQTLSSLSMCLLSLGRKEEALARAKRAAALDPESAQSLGLKAVCYAEVADYPKALESANLAIKADTNNAWPFTWFVKASTLNQMGRYAESLDAVDDYLKREPNSVEGLFIKGNSLENLQRYEEALNVYNKTARSDPGSSIRARLAKGLLLCSLGKIDEGLAEFNKFLPEDPGTRQPEVENLRRLLIETAHKLHERKQEEMAENARKAIPLLK